MNAGLVLLDYINRAITQHVRSPFPAVISNHDHSLALLNEIDTQQQWQATSAAGVAAETTTDLAQEVEVAGDLVATTTSSAINAVNLATEQTCAKIILTQVFVVALVPAIQNAVARAEQGALRRKAVAVMPVAAVRHDLAGFLRGAGLECHLVVRQITVRVIRILSTLGTSADRTLGNIGRSVHLWDTRGRGHPEVSPPEGATGIVAIGATSFKTIVVAGQPPTGIVNSSSVVTTETIKVILEQDDRAVFPLIMDRMLVARCIIRTSDDYWRLISGFREMENHGHYQAT